MNDALKELAQQLKTYKAPFFFLQKESKQALATRLAGNLLYDIEQLQRIDRSVEFCETAAIFYQKYARWKKIKAEVAEVGGDLGKYVDSFFENFVELFRQKLQQFYSDLHKRLVCITEKLSGKKLNPAQVRQVNVIFRHIMVESDDRMTVTGRFVAKLYSIQGSSVFVSEEILESIGRDPGLVKSYQFLKDDLAELQEELPLFEHFVSLNDVERKDFLSFLYPSPNFLFLFENVMESEYPAANLDEVIERYSVECKRLKQRANELILVESYRKKAAYFIDLGFADLTAALHMRVKEEKNKKAEDARKREEEARQHFKSNFFVPSEYSLFEGKNFYNLLSIAPDASQEDIKKAYKKAALLCHPDKHPNREEEFKRLGKAYDVLNDPQKRARYDHYLKTHPLPSGSNQNIVKR